MSDYWTDRAVPVLRAIQSPLDSQFDQSRILSLDRGRAEKSLGVALSDDVVYDTILQLGDAGYVEYNDITLHHPAGAHIMGLRLTGRGMQVLGEWPRFELLVSPLTFAALLDALADFAPEEEARAMRRASEIVKKMAAATLRSLVLGAGGQLARNALGLP